MAFSIMATFGGDASPLKKEYDGLAASARKSGAETAASLQKASEQLEKQIAAAVEGGQSWKNYGDQLNLVNARLQDIAKSSAAADAARYAGSPSQAGSINRQISEAEKARYQSALEGNTSGLATSATVAQAENEQMLRSSAALKELIEEKRKVREESARYQSALEGNTAGLKTVTDANRAENDALMEKSSALRQQIALREQEKNAALGQLQSGHVPENLKSTEFGAIAAARATENLKSKFADLARHGTGLNLVVRETLVIFREIGRGNWARVPGSLTVLGQGFAQLKGIALSTMGIIGGAIAAIAIPIYLVVSRTNRMVEGIHNLYEAFRSGGKVFADHARLLNQTADATRAAADATAEYSEWLRKLGDHEESLAEKTSATVTALREKARLQGELAQSTRDAAKANIDREEREGKITHQQANRLRGAAEKKEIHDKHQAELDGLKAELAIIDQATAAQKAKAAAAIEASKKVEDKAHGPDSIERGQQLAEARIKEQQFQQTADKAQEIRDAIVAKMPASYAHDESTYKTIMAHAGDPSAITLPDVKRRLAAGENINDIRSDYANRVSTAESKRYTVDVNGKPMTSSLKDLQFRYDTAQNDSKESTAERARLESEQKGLDKQTADAREKAQKEQESLQQLTKEGEKTKADLANKVAAYPGIEKQQFAAIDAREEKTKRASGGGSWTMTDQQRHGAYIGGPSTALLDVNKNMLRHLSSIDKKLGAHGGGGTPTLGGMRIK